MNKTWVTVYTHRGENIQILSGAAAGEIGYRIEGIEAKPLFSTVADAVKFIDEREATPLDD